MEINKYVIGALVMILALFLYLVSNDGVDLSLVWKGVVIA